MSRHAATEDDRSLWVMEVVALYDYVPEEHDELAFREGDTIRVVSVQDDGWWKGYTVESPRRIGVFPSNYVQVQHRRPVENRAHGGPQRQRVHHKAQVRFASLATNDGGAEEEEEEEEEESYQLQTLSYSTKTSSVLQLKQRLADAERHRRAAYEARRRAEQDQSQRPRVSRVGRGQWAGNDIEDQDDDDEQDEGSDAFYTQEQWRSQQRQIEEENKKESEDEDSWEGGGSGDDREKQYNANERGSEEEGEEEDLPPTPPYSANAYGGYSPQDHPESGSFSVPFDQQDMMDDVIAEYNDRRTHSVEQVAASRIARRYRVHHHHQVQEDMRRHKASSVITQSLRSNLKRSQESKRRHEQSAAARAIQRWLFVRVSSAREKAQREKVSNRQEDAATRIQRWIRQCLLYRKWLAHVEMERVKMAQRRDAERLHEQRERQEQQRQQHAEEVRKRLREQESRQMQEREQGVESKKPKKRVMKQEAVDLIKALVTQQLNAKLREHDDQMLELQRMVSRLQDVIREQSKMIQASTDEIVLLEQQQVRHTGQVPFRSSPSASLIEQPEPKTVLPAIYQQKPPAAPSVAGVANRPSGLKPPQQIERITRLPLVAPSKR